MADKLEPCPTPWCDEAGGEPYVFTRRKDCFGVYCPSCSVATPYFPTREEAVEFWNTRPAVADEITRLNAKNERLKVDQRVCDAEYDACLALVDEMREGLAKIIMAARTVKSSGMSAAWVAGKTEALITKASRE